MAINTLLHKEDIKNVKTIDKEAFIKMNEKINPIISGEIYDEIKDFKLDVVYECKLNITQHK